MAHVDAASIVRRQVLHAERALTLRVYLDRALPTGEEDGVNIVPIV